MSTSGALTARGGAILAGICALAWALCLPAPMGVAEPVWRCAVVAGVMALWWVSEAVPLPVTALLPMAVFPVLGLGTLDAVAGAYAHPLVWLFFGGFVVGIAVQHCGLHLRLATALLRALGDSPRRRVAGVLLASAFLSMWLNNTATALAMLPVALALAPRDPRTAPGLPCALMLSVAYGATIGGMATLVGTAPNAMLAAYLAREHGVVLSFAGWLMFGLPFAGGLLAVAWLTLTRELRPSVLKLDAPLPALPGLAPWSAPQRRVAMVFCAMVALWMGRAVLMPFVPWLTDTGIAISAALAMFLIPAGTRAGPILAWEDLAELPWGVLILFGGGLALAGAMETSGFAAAIGTVLTPLAALPTPVAIGLLAATLILLTEFASNTAIAAAFLPVAGALALGGDGSAASWAVPAALAASCGFMMPAGTPPNAIVFSGGHVTVRQMARHGLVLNLAAILLLALMVPHLLRMVVG